MFFGYLGRKFLLLHRNNWRISGFHFEVESRLARGGWDVTLEGNYGIRPGNLRHVISVC